MCLNKNFNPLPESEWRKSEQSENANNMDFAPTPRTDRAWWVRWSGIEDKRPFLVRLLRSVRFSPKVNLKGVHGGEIKGGTDF
jgi:hypothetical protein